MRHKHLLIFLHNFLTNALEVDNVANVLKEKIDSQYDCSKMQDNRKTH